MRGRVIAAFIAGVLCCAVFLGAGVGAFYALTNDAEAQAPGTWQVYQMPPPARIGWTLEEFEAWVHQIPVRCDIVPANQENMYLYRCPGA
jgi:hypothetical protein